MWLNLVAVSLIDAVQRVCFQILSTFLCEYSFLRRNESLVFPFEYIYKGMQKKLPAPNIITSLLKRQLTSFNTFELKRQSFCPANLKKQRWLQSYSLELVVTCINIMYVHIQSLLYANGFTWNFAQPCFRFFSRLVVVLFTFLGRHFRSLNTVWCCFWCARGALLLIQLILSLRRLLWNDVVGKAWLNFFKSRRKRDSSEWVILTFAECWTSTGLTTFWMMRGWLPKISLLWITETGIRGIVI